MSSSTDFIRERRSLKNVSPSTISWYTHALKWLPNESPSQNELEDAVLRMREKGRKQPAVMQRYGPLTLTFIGAAVQAIGSAVPAVSTRTLRS